VTILSHPIDAPRGRSISSKGTKSEAKVVIANWPQALWLEMFDLTQEEADAMWDVSKAIAERQGFSHTLSRQGDEITITLSRQSAE